MALLKPAGLLLVRFTVKFGTLPLFNVMVLNGLPKQRAVVPRSLRATLPITSPVPEHVPDWVSVCEPVFKSLFSVRTPLTVASVVNVTPLELLMVRLLNVVAEEPPTVWALVPLKVTVCELVVYVPSFVQVPAKFNAPLIELLKVIPLLMVKLPRIVRGLLPVAV